MQAKEKFSQVQFLSLLAFSVSIILTGSLFALKMWYPSSIYTVGILLGAFTVVTSLLSFQGNRLEAKLDEFTDQAKKLTGDALFDEEEGTDLSYSRRSLQFFELFVTGIFAFGAGLGGLFGVYFFWSYAGVELDAEMMARSTNAAAMMMGLAAGYFIFASYAGGVSRDLDSSKIRALSGWLFCSAIIVFALGAFEIAASLNLWDLKKELNYFLLIFIALLSAEILFGVFMESIRPRHSEEERAFLLESRILTILTSPGGVAGNIVHLIEYQTGIKVSENSFNVMFKKALLPILLVQFVWLYLLTMIVEIKPGYAGVRESFGKISRGSNGEVSQLQPGLNFKLPWPFGHINIYNVDKLSTLTIGQIKSPAADLAAPPMEDDPYKISDEEKVHVWGRKKHGMHGREGYIDFNYLAADKQIGHANIKGKAPMSMLTIKIPVHYKVKDIYKYLYNYKEPKLVLQSIAEQELVRHLGRTDYHSFMGTSRIVASDELKAQIQQRADKEDLGVNIVFLEIEASHPPVDTVLSHDLVMGAEFERDAKAFQAQTKAEREVSEANSYSLQILEEAKTEKVQRIAFARAQSERFEIQKRIYGQAPDIFKLVTYLDFIERDLNGVPKYIFNSPKAAKNIIINFEDNKNIGLLKSLSIEEEE